MTFIKSLLSIVTPVTIFVLWQLFFSHTIIQTPSSQNAKEVAYIATYPGYHNSLVINGNHGWKEFSYGDWEVYGKSHISFWTGFAAMGFPTKGALGFRSIEWDGQDTQVLAHQLGSINLMDISVEEEGAEELYCSLESHINQRSLSGVFNSNKHLFFVTHPKEYAAWHTCNNMLIEWVEQLGVQVTGHGWAGNFKKKSSSQ